jgi:hypothetical protein
MSSNIHCDIQSNIQSHCDIQSNIQLQLEEYASCIGDPFEFFKHVKILDATTNAVIDARVEEHNRRLIKSVYQNQLTIVLKSKQAWVSWTLAGIGIHWAYRMGAKVLYISSGQDAAIELLLKSRLIYTYLPKFLQQDLEHDGSELLGFKGTHSKIKSLPSTKDAGIGYTASLVVCDENEFHTYDKENYSAIEPTIRAGGHLVVVSTADPTNIDSHFKSLWRAAPDNGFHKIFIGCLDVPGRDEEWYEETKKRYALDWQFKANYPRTEEEALSPISGRSVFDANRLQKMLEKCHEPEEDRGAVKIYVPPKIGVQYMVGADIAEGSGNDYSVVWIEGKEGLERELCAVIHTNLMDVDTFAYTALKLLDEYFNPYVICGADSYGGRFLDRLVDLGYRRDRIYSSKKDKLGYQETSRTQFDDLVDLTSAINAGLHIYYKPAIEELFAMQYVDTPGKAKMQVAKGSHDDLVYSMTKCNWGFNHYLGIGERRIKTTYSKTWRGIQYGNRRS